MKKKILVMVPTAVLAVSLVIGAGTYALFTSSATNSGNTAKAGTVNLIVNRDHGDPTPGPIFYPNSLDPLALHPYDVSDKYPSGELPGGWAPGDSVIRQFTLDNTGSLSAKLVGLRAKVQDSYTQTTTNQELGETVSNSITGITAESDPDAYSEYLNNIEIEITYQTLPVFNGLLSDLIPGPNDDPETFWKGVLNENDLVIAPNKSGPLNLQIKATLKRTAGNSIQGKNIIFNIDFNAAQYKNNNN